MIDGLAAPLLFVSGEQVNAVVPFSVAASAPSELRIQAFGYESEPLSLPTAPAAPALFTTDGSGRGQAAALNEDGTQNSATNPASPKSVVAVYGTGFGVLTGSDLSSVALPVNVTVAGKQAELTYTASAPGLIVGVVQINFRIPKASSPATRS